MRERKPNRLQGYDYSQDNLYFVTSCVKNRMCCFGTIPHDEMIPNDYGQIAENKWHWLGKQYPYVVLRAFVVMPNHIHGIIEIDRSQIVDRAAVGTGRDLSLQQNGDLPPKHRGRSPQYATAPKIKPLSELMGAYKTTVSKQIHLTGYLDFAWQRSFHDHIIRNEVSYQKIADYILNNPSQWEEDEFYNKGK